MLYREIILGTTAALCLAGPGHAQDRWEGFYGGLAIDAIQGESTVGNSTVHTYQGEAAKFGLYGGYNFVREGGFVWGPEVSLSAVASQEAKNNAALGGSVFEGGFLLSPRLRAGYATENAFFYGLVGLGISDAGAKPAGNDDSNVQVAPSVGIGAEFALGDDWSTKIEAVYHKFDDKDYEFNGLNQSVNSDLKQITIGISRKF